MGNEIVCPWHLWGFDVTSGACTGDPSISVPAYEVRVEDDRVLVSVE
jgi:nitrite reductase/ring-hydroxylating ferredoxin subunit